MLISFKVSNSRSIGEELEFSAIATEDTILPENTIDLPKYGIRILKTMALFGANASGKTNILQAFADARNIICTSNFNRKKISFPFNRNHSENNTKSIAYSFTFLIDETVYNYSFKHDQEHILEELLTENIDAEKEQIIYSRKFNTETKKYEWLPKKYFNSKNFEHFIYDNDNQDRIEKLLFLTLSHSPFLKKDILLEEIFNWFEKQLKPTLSLSGAGKFSGVYPILSNNALQLSADNNFNFLINFIQKSESNKKLILNFLKKVDINIDNIQIVELIGNDTTTIRAYNYVNPDKENEEQDEKGIRVLIKTYHKAVNEKNEIVLEEFDFRREESSGTKIFLAWLGFWLYSFQKEEKPSIFTVDELGTSLHPKLAMYLIKLFANKETNPYNSQLIFTTHEVKLMDKTVMRPDQLYLINKDNQGNTSMERASDYAEIEKYVRLDTLYLNGGMSGTPMINL
ncbi:MAG: ATP-binding protein [Bacteroidetes bacterium]|nr:MAG: ATP-binding protein [Bacteroidota bacterium]